MWADIDKKMYKFIKIVYGNNLYTIIQSVFNVIQINIKTEERKKCCEQLKSYGGDVLCLFKAKQ